MIIEPLTAILYTLLIATVALVTMRRAHYGVCTLIAVAPFAFSQSVVSTTLTLPKAALLGVLLGLLAYPRAFAPLGDGAPARIVRAGLAVLLATLLTLAVATYHGAVLREALKILEYVVLFCAVVAGYRLDPDRRAIRVTIVATTMVVAVLALLQEVIGAPSAMLLNGHAIPRIAGPLEGPNQLAGYFDVALPTLIALCVEETTTFCLAALFLVVCADVLTFSRGGALGAVAASITAMLVLRHNLRAPLFAMCAGLAAGVASALTWGVVAHTLGLERFWDLRASSYGGGVGTRPELWRAAWTLWRRHPLLGVGAGNFEREIPLTGLQGVRTHANSLYLQSLVEGGIVLFGATLWLVYTSIATFARERRNETFVVAAFAAGIGLAAHQLVDLLTFYPKVGAEWWIVMALGAAQLTSSSYSEQPACA